MDALILSCATGGGHHAAACALKEALDARGWHADLLDPYTLSGGGLDRRVGGCYIGIAQKTPRLFGFIYRLGSLYSRLPWHSPVYRLNRRMRPAMQAYLTRHHYDVIFATHLYPAEILTYMKDAGDPLPPTVFVATDYTCIPFTEETRCDAYAIPAPDLREEYVRRGIPAEKIVPTGIPVRAAFSEDIGQAEAKRRLGLDPQRRLLAVAGGSIGAGQVEKTVRSLCEAVSDDWQIAVICGSNEKLLHRLRRHYGDRPNLRLLGRTEEMALYMKASDAFLSKPGGLSSTEAAAAGCFLIHLPPIPGCETANVRFFQQRGMSLASGSSRDSLRAVLAQLDVPGSAEAMQACQRAALPPRAAQSLCCLAETLATRQPL